MREQLAAQESLFAGLNLGKPPELSADFTQRVLSQAMPRSKNRPFNRLLLGLLVLAAVLLVALLPVSWLLQFRGGTGHQEAAGTPVAICRLQTGRNGPARTNCSPAGNKIP